MKSKVHPHRTLVKSGVEACVSVTPNRRGGRAYYMGTVSLSDVSFVIHQSGVKRARDEQTRNVHAWAVGDVLYEFTEQHEPSEKMLDVLVKVTYHYNLGRFVTDTDNPVDVTDKTFRAALFVGGDFYVSRDSL